MSTNKTLNRARKNRDDEFYTSLKDVKDAVEQYKDEFKGKKLWLPCDNPNDPRQQFLDYFKSVYTELELKSLTATSKEGYFWSFDGQTNETGCIDGDFRSKECAKLFQESDIICTNPPFSLFRAFFKLLFEYNKKFLIIGDVGIVTYKHIFPLFRDGKFWFANGNGQGETNKYMLPQTVFTRPDGTIIKGNKCTWCTNLGSRINVRTTYISYNSMTYEKYDDYDAIEVGKSKNVPNDYDGEMGVPYTFLGTYNPELFELIKVRGFKLHGKNTAKRILIRKRR